MPSPIFNIPAIVAHHGHARPDRPAVIDGEVEITYGDLERRVCQWANRFRALGLAPGARIGFCLTDHSDHVIAILAALRAELPFLCMDWRLTQAEVGDRVAAYGLRLVVHDAEARAKPANGILRDDAWRETILRAPDSFPVPTPAADAVALLAASSGTTGKPEVVSVSHGALVARAISDNWLTHAPDCGDKVLRALPIAFSLGRGFNFGYFCAGCASVLMPSFFGPQDYVDAIRRHGIAHANANPTLLAWLLEHAPETGHLLPGLRVLLCTGATLSAERKRALLDSVTPNLFEKYGTVTTGIVATARPEDIRAHPGSVGRLAFGVELQVVDRDGREVPHGAPGALRCRSPQAATPFRPDAAAGGSDTPGPAGRWRDGYWYTDDHGMFDEAGYLHLLGRSASLIIRAGVNIYAEELEEILSGHPAVGDVAVVGRPAAELGDEPVALVVCSDGHAPAARDLIAFCRTRISRMKAPVDVLFVDKLPRGQAGKLRRTELPDVLRSAAAGGSDR